MCILKPQCISAQCMYSVLQHEKAHTPHGSGFPNLNPVMYSKMNGNPSQAKGSDYGQDTKYADQAS
ncbi:hypothetical protein C8Q80DRAFT_63938 [Daedaleopsis nitida]|nr:hypothetical protein C8Q80DRAFT_63938 [Daedaleopsis nitida]